MISPDWVIEAEDMVTAMRLWLSVTLNIDGMPLDEDDIDLLVVEMCRCAGHLDWN